MWSSLPLLLAACRAPEGGPDPSSGAPADSAADTADSETRETGGDTGEPIGDSSGPTDSGTTGGDSGDSGGADVGAGAVVIADAEEMSLVVATAGDTSGDGHPDLVVHAGDLGLLVVPVPDAGTIGASASATARLGYRTSDDAQLGDLDGDGALDVLSRVPHFAGEGDTASRVYEASIYLGPTVGTPSQDAYVGMFYWDAADDSDLRIVGDVDADGVDDVLLGGDDRRDGHWLYRAVPATGGAVSDLVLLGTGTDPEWFDRGGFLDLGDTSGDGVDDLWMGGAVYHGPVEEGLDLDAPDTLVTFGSAEVAAADVDGDGLSDIVATDTTVVWVVPAGASGTPGDIALGHLDVPDPEERWSDAAPPADTDGDGCDDLSFSGTSVDGDPVVHFVPGPIVGAVDLGVVGRTWTGGPEQVLTAEAVLAGEERVVVRDGADDDAGVLYVLGVED